MMHASPPGILLREQVGGGGVWTYAQPGGSLRPVLVRRRKASFTAQLGDPPYDTTINLILFPTHALSCLIILITNAKQVFWLLAGFWLEAAVRS